MKRALLLVTAILFFGLQQSDAKRIYVKAGSHGNGNSWTNAIGDLQKALKIANSGDQIWVAKGKYFPTTTGDRTASFRIPDDIQIFGGFAGTEEGLTERNWKVNKTILSGEIGTPAIDDNSYSVVFTLNVSASTLIDGFIITGGSANAIGESGDTDMCGAGWFNDGSGKESSPTINNCIFINNYAREGAAIFNYAKNGTCNPSIYNCMFISNRADLDGGAIYNDGNYGKCSPKIRKCYFEGNEATYGAGILNRGTNGIAKPVISECIFVSNLSIIKGSGIYNHRQGRGICNPIISTCRFENNRAGVGYEISNTINNVLTDKEDRTGYVLKTSGY